jgi:hypothetical protein
VSPIIAISEGVSDAVEIAAGSRAAAQHTARHRVNTPIAARVRGARTPLLIRPLTQPAIAGGA